MRNTQMHPDWKLESVSETESESELESHVMYGFRDAQCASDIVNGTEATVGNGESVLNENASVGALPDVVKENWLEECRAYLLHIASRRVNPDHRGHQSL